MTSVTGNSLFLVGLGRLTAEEELALVAAKVDDDLLEDDAGILWMDGQGVDILRGREGKRHLLLHHTTGDGGVVDAVDVLRLLVEVGVEVDAHGTIAVDRYIVDEAALVEEVEGRFGDDVDLSRLCAVVLETVSQFGIICADGVGHQ